MFTLQLLFNDKCRWWFGAKYGCVFPAKRRCGWAFCLQSCRQTCCTGASYRRNGLPAANYRQPVAKITYRNIEKHDNCFWSISHWQLKNGDRNLCKLPEGNRFGRKYLSPQFACSQKSIQIERISVHLRCMQNAFRPSWPHKSDRLRRHNRSTKRDAARGGARESHNKYRGDCERTSSSNVRSAR